jgi:hypothetical protein
MKTRIAFLIACTALILIGCGKSNEHGIFRSGDMITLYWVLQENAEIANFELTDNVLELDIDTGESQEKQMLRINFAANHETLEIKGMSRLDELVIGYFRVSSNPTH